MGRTLTQWMSERKRAVKNGDSNNALAVHMSNNQATTSNGKKPINILARDVQWTKRKIKEGIAVKEKKITKGFQIDNNWFLLPCRTLDYFIIMLRSHIS